MKSIFEAIKEQARSCAEKRRCFYLPLALEEYVDSHEDDTDRCTEEWVLKKGDLWIKIETSLRDGSRTNQTRSDKCTISVTGRIPEEVSYRDTWEEGRRIF